MQQLQVEAFPRLYVGIAETILDCRVGTTIEDHPFLANLFVEAFELRVEVASSRRQCLGRIDCEVPFQVGAHDRALGR